MASPRSPSGYDRISGTREVRRIAEESLPSERKPDPAASEKRG